jgi:hypothetical protein
MKNKNHSIEVTTTEEDNKYADYKYTNISMFDVVIMWEEGIQRWKAEDTRWEALELEVYLPRTHADGVLSDEP